MTKINIAKLGLFEYVSQNTMHEIIIAPRDAAKNEAPASQMCIGYHTRVLWINKPVKIFNVRQMCLYIFQVCW